MSVQRNKGVQKYFFNTSWLFLEQVSRILASLLVGIWVIRYLGPEQYGLLAYAASFVGLFAIIAPLGLDGIVVRELVKDESKRDKLLGSAFVLKLSGACIVLLLLAIAVKIIPNDVETNIYIFIIASSSIFQSFNVINFYFQSRVLSKFVSITNTISLIIISSIKISLVLFQAPLIYFVYILLLDAIILAFGYLYFYSYKKLSIRKWAFDKQVAFSLLKDSWPLMLSSVMGMVYYKIDQVMLKQMLDNKAVGLYAAAAKLSEAWYFIPIIISSSFFPAIVSAKKQSTEKTNSRIKFLLGVTAWISLLIALVITFLAKELIGFLYGEKYIQSVTVLMIHVWAGLFVSLGVVSGKWLLVENLVKIALWRNLLGVISNVIINLLLIPRYGIVGAALATLISYSISAFFYDFFNSKTRNMFFMKLEAIVFPGKLLKLWKEYSS
jgi:O-antigen/teichoic acid export membrane protein